MCSSRPSGCLFVQLYLRLSAAPKSAGGENDGHFGREEYALETKGREAYFGRGAALNLGRGQGQAKAKWHITLPARGHPISPNLPAAFLWQQLC